MASTFVASSDGHGVVDVHMGNGELAVGYGFRERPSQRHADDLIGRLFIALYQNFTCGARSRCQCYWACRPPNAVMLARARVDGQPRSSR